MTTRRRLLVPFVLLFAGAAACGGSKPPAAPGASATDGGAAEPAAASASPEPADAASPVGAAPATSDAGAEPAPSTPSAGTITSDPEDACTPVGVDFEKRARPELKACYRAGKKKDPNLEGTVKISVDINTLGKISSIKITEKTLPNPVAQCMLKVVKKTPLPEASKCPGKAIVIPVTFPTPR